MHEIVSEFRQAGGHPIVPFAAIETPASEENQGAVANELRASYLRPIASRDRSVSRFDRARPPLLACVLQALEGLAQGMALFTQDSQLLYANAAAQYALSQSAWTQQDGLLLSQEPVELEAWTKALRHAVTKQARSLVEIRQRNGTLFIATTPVLVGLDCFVLASFGPQMNHSTYALKLFAKHVNLTAAEIEVMEKLFAGMKPAEIARTHKVSVTTVVSQLKSIRSKTGCATVPNLLIKLSRLPTLRPADILGVSVNMFG